MKGKGGSNIKKLSTIIIMSAFLFACANLEIQNRQSSTTTKDRIEQINSGMTYDQIAGLLGSPGEKDDRPSSLLKWTQDGCYLEVFIEEDKLSISRTWCDEVCKEEAGETWCKPDVPNPFSKKIKSGMTYHEIVKAVGKPHQERKMIVYDWSGTNGSRKNKVTVYFVDNIAVEVFTFSLTEK